MKKLIYILALCFLSCSQDVKLDTFSVYNDTSTTQTVIVTNFYTNETIKTLTILPNTEESCAGLNGYNLKTNFGYRYYMVYDIDKTTDNFHRSIIKAYKKDRKITVYNKLDVNIKFLSRIDSVIEIPVTTLTPNDSISFQTWSIAPYKWNIENAQKELSTDKNYFITSDNKKHYFKIKYEYREVYFVSDN